MIEYEELLDNAEKENITVIENYDFSNTRLKGLYCNKIIALNKHIETEQEKKCILAEELRHHHTAIGNILDQSSVSNRKQLNHYKSKYGRYISQKIITSMKNYDVIPVRWSKRTDFTNMLAK